MLWQIQILNPDESTSRISEKTSEPCGFSITTSMSLFATAVPLMSLILQDQILIVIQSEFLTDSIVHVLNSLCFPSIVAEYFPKIASIGTMVSYVHLPSKPISSLSVVITSPSGFVIVAVIEPWLPVPLTKMTSPL